MTTTTSRAAELVRSAEGITEHIDALENERDAIHGRLEAAATAWYKQGGKSLRNPRHPVVGCMVCSFQYAGIISSDRVGRHTKGQFFPPEDHLMFRTTCTYDCGGGTGVDVPVSFVDRFLEEHA